MRAFAAFGSIGLHGVIDPVTGQRPEGASYDYQILAGQRGCGGRGGGGRGDGWRPCRVSQQAVAARCCGEKVTSQKWAGYAALADSRKDFRYVAADFIVRSPSACHTQDNQPGSITTTQWIGLGGYSRGITEQIGVVETCAFMDDDEWEFWASYSGASGSGAFFGCEEVHGDTCPHGIDGGDRVELSVYYNGKSYRLILRDVTKKISKTIYERCSKCTSKSAEVISLAASTATNPPLTGLSNVSFFGVRATSADGKHGTMAPQPRYWTTAEITRLDSAGDTVGKPYPLLRHGRAFSVTAYAFTGP